MPRAAIALIALVTLIAPARAAFGPSRPLWVAVVAPDFADALAPLADTRREQGFRVVVVRTTDVVSPRQLLAGDVAALRDHVRALCRDHHGERHVLLVGAIDSLFAGRVVPALLGSAGRMKGEPTDAPYAIPGVAVGRFPARNADEAAAMVNKTLALEKAGRAAGAWKRRLTVLAGIPAYNPFVDRLVEGLAMSRFDRVAPAWAGRAVYTNPSSRFCLPAKELGEKALDYLMDGQAFTLYLGHSNAQLLYGGPEAPFLDRGDWGRAVLPHGGGVFVTFGCNGCQLMGGDGEGYGLWAMRNPRGPAAVVGSHGVCFAAMVNLAADGLFRRAFQTTSPRRLASAWLAGLDAVAKDRIDWITYRALDAVDGDPRIPQATQRAEHLEMFVLLGDPALRLPEVDAIRLDAPASIAAGERIVVSGELPEGMTTGRVEVSLERTPAAAPADLVAVPRQPGPARDRALRANHDKANRFALVSVTAKAREGRFTAELEVPAELTLSACVIRAYAAGGGRDALAARRVTVRKAPQ